MHYHGHRERLRKRLTASPETMPDYELLELLLGYVLRRQDTKPLAKELLARFGSLRSVFHAPPAEFRSIKGVGPGVEVFWALLHEIISRIVEGPIRERVTLASAESVAQMARERLGRLEHEEVWVAYLDSQNRLINWERVAKGTINSSSINPRDILERCLLLKASAFILVHNHPGGGLTPSGADIHITERISKAAQTLFIRFLDHIIVSESGWSSVMRDNLL